MPDLNPAPLLLLLCLPALALWLVARFGWARRLGTIVLCYSAGLLVGNLDLLPASAAATQSAVSQVSIALALPMILFTMDVRAWTRTAPKALLSMALAVVSVMTVATALFVAYRQLGTDRPYELAGLAVGVYTGGTPNLAAIKTALGVADARYLMFNAYDTVVSAAYLMFMVTLAKPWFGRLLTADAPKAEPRQAQAHAQALAPTVDMHDENYATLLSRHGLGNVARSLVLAVTLVALAVVTAQLAQRGDSPALVITLLATFGIGASLVPRIRGLVESYKAGMYLIYVFSFTVATMAKFESLRDVDPALPAFIATAVFGSLVLHALLCRIARIDVDTFLVTSVSAICSPAFVPLVARSLGSPALLLSGITTGIIGYAIGTYLGTGLALLLKHYF